MRRAALAFTLALGAASCSPSPPTVSLNVTQGAGAPDIVGLARLQLLVQTCGRAEPLVNESLPVRGEAIAARELDILPGTEMYVHLRGWLDCAGNAGDTCTPADQAGVNDCVCPEKAGDPAQILRAEGCSEWFAAEVDRQVTISLGDRLGLCPPPATACNAASE